MATEVYESGTVNLIDGRELYITPLKIKYLRQFMVAFENVRKAKGDGEAIEALAECARIAMKQFCPEISKTIEELEDNINLPSIYTVLKYSAGINVDGESEEPVKDQAVESSSSWDNLDLAKLESEVFLLGIWKDYEELETSLSMPELVLTLNIKRDLDYDEKKFLAAMQGVDLDKETGQSNTNAWEEMKARVFSGGKAANANDVLALQGVNAQRVGFGIGMGLDYEDLT